MNYRGRIAPSPTGLLHAGHARTFFIAQERARSAGGTLVLRMEDIDRPRCRPEFARACYEDLRWFGLSWDEGPDVGGPNGPYEQSQCMPRYRQVLAMLIRDGHVYPCWCSRKDVAAALAAPHGDEEPIYPGTCRPEPPEKTAVTAQEGENFHGLTAEFFRWDPTSGRVRAPGIPSVVRTALGDRGPPEVAGAGAPVTWRFRVRDGETVCFVDGAMGKRRFVAGKDFGDFPVWRKDDLPAYQLAVVADDAAMGITEVVRGADLLVSTARQLLLYRALGWNPPAFHHVPLVADASGKRLAKREAGLALRALREQGKTPGDILSASRLVEENGD